MVIIKWTDGAVFLGELKNNRRNGFGMFFKPSIQGLYIGSYKNDKKEGFGIYRWKNGDLFMGEFRNGQRNGYGVMFWRYNITESGYWENGKLIYNQKR